MGFSEEPHASLVNPWQWLIFPPCCQGSIVSAGACHFRVRDGNGWVHPALTTKEYCNNYATDFTNWQEGFIPLSTSSALITLAKAGGHLNPRQTHPNNHTTPFPLFPQTIPTAAPINSSPLRKQGPTAGRRWAVFPSPSLLSTPAQAGAHSLPATKPLLQRLSPNLPQRSCRHSCGSRNPSSPSPDRERFSLSTHIVC